MHDTLAIAHARSIISKWNIRHPLDINIEDIAADLNVIIIERPNISSAARIVSIGETGIITVNKQIPELGKKRFAIAHELGHFGLHRKKSPIEICTELSFLEWYKKSDEEQEANAFAVELLMPTDIFRTFCANKTPSLKEIGKIADEFQTSLTATAIRYVELGKTPCAIIASKDEKVNWFAVNPSFPYRIKGKGTPLHEFACANDYFNKGATPSEPETVAGVAWLEDYIIGSKCFLYEEVIPLKAYNTTLSLIWIRQDYNRQSRPEPDSSHHDPDHFTPDGKRYRW